MADVWWNRRAHPLRALAILIAIPIAAWAAMHVPNATKSAARAVAPVAVQHAPKRTQTRSTTMHLDQEKVLEVVMRVSALQQQAATQSNARMEALHQRLQMWDTLAHCESQGHWNVVDRFGGGLGIYVGTWHMFHGDEFASNPGYATKAQQIIVAERIYARFGLSGWGCAHELGWVR